MGNPIGLLEQLKEKYAVIDDPIYKECLVIPATEFGKAWDEQLRAEGHKIFQNSVGGRAVFFVQLAVSKLGQSETQGESKLVYEPPAEQTRKKHLYGFRWTQDEDKELIKGVTLNLTDAQIAEKLPGRTQVAVKQRRGRLEKHGILPGKKSKRGRPPGRKTSTPAPGGVPFPIHKDEPLPTPTPTPIPTSTAAPATPAREPAFQIRTTLTINLNVNCNDALSVQNALKILQEARGGA